MGVLGLILGIIGLAGGIICPFAFPLIGLGELIFVALAILGLIFSAIGRKRARRSGRGTATAGLVISIIAIVLSVIFTFACTAGKKVTDVVTNELSTVDEVQLESLINEVIEEPATQEQTQAPDEAPATEEAAQQANASGGLTADIVIEYGDVDAITDLAKQAQNFEVAQGTVAQISGVFSSGISTPAVQEPDGNGNYKGINMYVDGDWEKPADHTDIDVTGTFEKGSFFMEFHVLPENITVK